MSPGSPDPVRYISTAVQGVAAGSATGLEAGVGLRAQHHREILEGLPRIAWFEAHSENYFACGGAARQCLRQIRSHYPVSLHGVGLSLGSTDEIATEHLDSLAALVRDIEPLFVSEHLSWGSVGGRFTNDLLPLPYTPEALGHMVSRVSALQDRLQRQVLIENVSSYLEFSLSSIPEWDFLAELAHRTGCGILLDVNNVYVSARNHGFDPIAYITALPREAVQELHLAGHSVNRCDAREIRIDTHDRPVCPEVWELYTATIRCLGARPTLIEWDSDIPPLPVLQGEALKANRVLEATHALAA